MKKPIEMPVSLFFFHSTGPELCPKDHNYLFFDDF